MTKLLQIENGVFREWRLRMYGLATAAALLGVLAWEVGQGRSVVAPGGGPTCPFDFCTIWVSGNFALSSDPARAYDYQTFAAAQAAVVAPDLPNILPYHFAYPPISLFFAYPLGMMPYFTAFVVWICTTFLLYEIAIYAILPRFTAVIAAATPLVVSENFKLGQNGMLTAGLIGLSLAFAAERPVLGGFFLGLLLYKPQFGVLFPLALLASRNWRMLGSAIVTSLILLGASVIAFGYEGWLSFISELGARTSGLSTEPQFELTLQSVFGLLRWAGAVSCVSWGLHVVAVAAVALIVFIVWAKPLPHALKAATLCIGAVAVTPYVQIYDLCILSVAVVFFLKDGLAQGFLPGERVGVLACWAGLFLLLMPLGPIIYAFLFYLIAQRLFVFRRDVLLAPFPAFGGIGSIGRRSG